MPTSGEDPETHTNATPVSRTSSAGIFTGVPRDALAHLSGFAVSLVVAFALVPVLLHGLTPADYGAWLLFQSASATLGTFVLALWWSVSRELAGSDDSAPPIAFLSDALIATALIGLAGGSLLWVAGARGWMASAGITSEQRLVLSLAGASFLLDQLAACATAILTGRSRFGALNLLLVGTNLVRAAGIVTALAMGGGLLGVALWHLGIGVVGTVALMWAAWKTLPWIRHLRPVAPLTALRARAGYAWPLQLSLLLGAAIIQAVPLMIARVIGTAAVVPFALGTRIPQAISAAAHRVAQSAYPKLVQVSRMGSGDALNGAVATSTRWAIVVMLPLSSGLWLAAPQIFEMWLGEWPTHAVAIFRLAIVACMLDVLVLPIDSALNASGRTRIVLGATACAALALVVGLALLLRPLGVLGAGIALLGSSVAWVAAYIVIAARLGILSASSGIARAIAPAVLPLVLMIGLIIVTGSVLERLPPLAALTIIGVGTLLFMAWIGARCATAGERAALARRWTARA